MMQKGKPTLNAQIENVLEEKVLGIAPNTSNEITLQEKNKHQPDMKVVLSGIPAPVTTIRMSKKFGHLSVLKGGDWTKICDYLLIAQIAETHCAIFIELKRTLAGEDHPKEQLRRSRPLLEYLLAVCRIESREKIPMPSMSYILIADKINKRFDKQPVKKTPSGKIGEESYKEINIKKFLGPRVAFADLVCDS